MPRPVSLTISTARPFSDRVPIVTRPPGPIASSALLARFSTNCLISPSSAAIAGAFPIFRRTSFPASSAPARMSGTIRPRISLRSHGSILTTLFFARLRNSVMIAFARSSSPIIISKCS